MLKAPAGSRSALLSSIAESVADYRVGEIDVPTPEHVDRWARQFPADVQLPLLRELDHVLERTYISRSAMVQFIDLVLTSPRLVGTDPCTFWENAALLSIQQNGSSQEDMLELMSDGLQRLCNLSLEDCGGSSGKYIYLDDVLFTGSRIGNDLSAWIDEEAPPEAEVQIVVYASHTLGEYQCLKRLKQAASEAGKHIRISILKTATFESRLKYRDKSDLLWPAELPGDPEVQAYLQLPHKFPFSPRQPGGPLGPFSSEEGRQLLERELLVAGANIRASCANPKDVMRPLGFSAFGLGFGSMIVTHRNCPNNAPLALWWGVPTSRGHADWYPLFRRKGYSEDDEQDGFPF